jgi:indolepyruvate ferredoxin oxidoreductase alpha subunit
LLLSGNEAIAQAAFDAGVALGCGYPGTPSTEILEQFGALGGKAQWAPNEKVAFEVALGAGFAGAGAIVTMKHVGLNVAADVLFTAAYTGTAGPLVVVSADDPGMASSQNEQDNRRFAVAAGVPMLEPSDSQEAYRFTLRALEISRRWKIPVILRVTTRVCHSKTLVDCNPPSDPPPTPHFEHNIPGLVMIPANARPAHRRLRQKLAEIAAWNEQSDLNPTIEGGKTLGIITSGICTMHVREASPEASVLKLEMTHPLPFERIARFARSVDRCVVIEENDPYLVEQLRSAGIAVEGKPEMYRFGELNVKRVRRILAGDTSAEPAPSRGKPPALCVSCPHRAVYSVLSKLKCIVPGDIGCYSLGALPPFEAMDTLVCMGAAIGMGLGMRHVLPEEEARRVVSVIGDSTFVHSGITGLVEMVYNRPSTGHVVVILDNGTTAMTGLQEHPGTGRTLSHEAAGQVSYENLARSLGIQQVHVIDPSADSDRFEQLLRDSLASNDLTLIVARRPCLLAAGKIKEYNKRNAEGGLRKGEAAQPRVSPCIVPASKSRIPASTINVVIAGLGGQGVIKASDILADAAFAAGCDVKKAEVHGMSQRGGSVSSDVRFGSRVYSPMVPYGEADYLITTAEDQIENNCGVLRPSGVLIPPTAIDPARLPNRRSMNVALLGLLSRHLDIAPEAWHHAIRANLKPELYEVNLAAFDVGRQG